MINRSSIELCFVSAVESPSAIYDYKTCYCIRRCMAGVSGQCIVTYSELPENNNIMCAVVYVALVARWYSKSQTHFVSLVSGYDVSHDISSVEHTVNLEIEYRSLTSVFSLNRSLNNTLNVCSVLLILLTPNRKWVWTAWIWINLN